MIRRIFAVASLLVLMNTFVSAQYNDGPSTAERFPTVPPFSLIGIDSSTFTRDKLEKNKKTIIMYFSPDCDHCQAQTEALLKEYHQLKGCQVLMATYDPYEKMVEFYKKYKLENYPLVLLGRDPQFFFVPYYKIENMPFIATYNEKGELVKTYRNTITAERIITDFVKKDKKKS